MSGTVVVAPRDVVAHDPRGNARDHAVGRHLLAAHDRPHRHDRAVPDVGVTRDHGVLAEPHVAAEADVRIDFADLTALLYLQGFEEEDIVR